MPEKHRLHIDITGEDSASSILRKVQRAVKGLEERSGKTSRNLKTHRGAVDGLAGSYKKWFAILGGATVLYTVTRLTQNFIKSTISARAELERYTVQYRVLYKDVDLANQKLKEWIEFAKTTPFELPEIVRAGRLLKIFGLDTVETMTMVGDSASATGQDIEQLAFWIGRLASGNVGESLMRLTEMGALTRKELEMAGLKFKGSGQYVGDVKTLMNTVHAILTEKFSGMMEEQSKTFSGMISNMQDAWWRFRTLVAEDVFEKLKKDLEGILKTIDQWTETGALELWADKVGNRMEDLLMAIEGILGVLQAIGIIPKDLPDSVVGVQKRFNELTWEIKQVEGNIERMKASVVGGMGGMGGAIETQERQLKTLRLEWELLLKQQVKLLGQYEEYKVPPKKENIEQAKAIVGEFVVYTEEQAHRLKDIFEKAVTEYPLPTPDIYVGKIEQEERVLEQEATFYEFRKALVDDFIEKNREAYDLLSMHHEQFWQLAIRADMTGSQKKKVIWDSIKSSTAKIISDMLRDQITYALALESISSKGIVTYLKEASAKIFSAHAHIPFAGVAIATALIGAMYALMKSLGSFQYGTPYVPKTGMYMLHRGEAVIPRTENYYGGNAEINFNVQVSDTAMLPMLDAWSDVVLLPRIKRLIEQRKL